MKQRQPQIPNLIIFISTDKFSKSNQDQIMTSIAVLHILQTFIIVDINPILTIKNPLTLKSLILIAQSGMNPEQGRQRTQH